MFAWLRNLQVNHQRYRNFNTLMKQQVEDCGSHLRIFLLSWSVKVDKHICLCTANARFIYQYSIETQTENQKPAVGGLKVDLNSLFCILQTLQTLQTPEMNVPIESDQNQKSGNQVVFGTCNHFFTQYRKYRHWDNQVNN